MIRAVYDACILYSALLRDILLCLAEAKLVFPLWSEEIHDEWIRNLLQNRPDLQREKLLRTCREMDFHFPGSLQRGYESIIPTLTLPDPQDRHVLAVAIHAEANYIITNNLDDFPNDILRIDGIEALSPDKFVLRLIQQASAPVLEVVKNHRSSLVRPPKTVDEYLATLEKQGLSDTVAFLRKHKDVI